LPPLNTKQTWGKNIMKHAPNPNYARQDEAMFIFWGRGGR